MNEHFEVERINYIKMAVDKQISLEEAYINIIQKSNLSAICDSDAWSFYNNQTENIQLMIVVHYMIEKGYVYNGENFEKKENK